MPGICRGLLALWLLLAAGDTTAADVIVPVGSGTLASAITTAAPGDTLILQTGAYTDPSPGLTIDKDLVLRASTAGSTPVVSPDLTLDGAQVTLQGLTLDGVVTLAAGVNAGVFDSTLNAPLTGTGELVLVGGVANSLIDVTATEVIVAGASLQDRVALSAVTATMVGNVIGGTINCPIDPKILLAAEQVRMWANRTVISSVGGTGSCVVFRVSADYGSVRNNLFKILGGTANPGGFAVLRLGENASLYEVENNLFDLGSVAVTNARTVQAESFSLLRGNFFVNSSFPNLRLGLFDPAGSASRFENNLCFNTSEPCPTGDGNLNADPMFVDSVDYALMAGSPGVDAGPVDGVVLDLDGSRVDLGLYGGLFPIDLYDAQRQPGRTDPYVYPLFDASRGLDGLGGLEVRTLGVARLP